MLKEDFQAKYPNKKLSRRNSLSVITPKTITDKPTLKRKTSLENQLTCIKEISYLTEHNHMACEDEKAQLHLFARNFINDIESKAIENYVASKQTISETESTLSESSDGEASRLLDSPIGSETSSEMSDGHSAASMTYTRDDSFPPIDSEPRAKSTELPTETKKKKRCGIFGKIRKKASKASHKAFRSKKRNKNRENKD